MTDNWKLWTPAPRRMCHSTFLRYSVAVLLPLLAVVLIQLRPSLSETPFFIFLGAVLLSALYGGLGPGFLSTALSSVLIRVLYTDSPLGLHYGLDREGMEQKGFFFLVALLAASLTAALRQERNLLRESEGRFRSLAETALDAIVVIDEVGVIRFVNPGAERMFGATARQMLGRNLTTVLPKCPYWPHLAELQRQRDSRCRAVAVPVTAPQGSGETRLLEMTLSTFSRHGRDLFTAIFRDVTGRLHAGCDCGPAGQNA